MSSMKMKRLMSKMKMTILMPDRLLMGLLLILK